MPSVVPQAETSVQKALPTSLSEGYPDQDVVAANEVFQKSHDDEQAGQPSTVLTSQHGDEITNGVHHAQTIEGQQLSHSEDLSDRQHRDSGHELPPLPLLFPIRPMSSDQIQGDWQLIASSTPAWRARRSVQAHFKYATQKPRPSESKGAADHKQMEAEWTYYEIASFQPKTLTQRILEEYKSKQRRKSNSDSPENEQGGEHEGERKISVCGKMWSTTSGRSFVYRPRRTTVQKALGRDIRWEIIAYGTTSPSLASTGHSIRSDQRPEQAHVDWFVAYVYPQPFLHPFLSIYFRPQVVRDSPDTVAILMEDIVDALHHSLDPSLDETTLAQEEQINATEAQNKLTAEIVPDDNEHGRRGRTRGRGPAEGNDASLAPPTLFSMQQQQSASGGSAVPLAQRVNAGISGHAPPAASTTFPPSTSASNASVATATTDSNSDRKAEKKREDLKWSIHHMAAEVRLVRGIAG